MQLVLSTSGINGYSSLEYSLSYSTEYSTPKLLVSGSPNYKKLCYCRRRARRNLSVKIGIRDDGIAANTAMITVHRAQQNLHHCQKSTSSRYYRLTRLHVCSIESIDRLDLSRLCGSNQLQRLSIISRSNEEHFWATTWTMLDVAEQALLFNMTINPKQQHS